MMWIYTSITISKDMKNKMKNNTVVKVNRFLFNGVEMCMIKM